MPEPTLAGNGTNGKAATVEQLILCVDDDAEFLKSLEVFLPNRINAEAESGVWYRFLFFTNAREALATLRELVEAGEAIAMVISDQKMPDMKGTELLAEVQKRSEQSIRVLLTGHAGIESAILAINEHLLDKYLTKPIEDDHDFTLSVKHLLQRFEMQRTIREQSEAIAKLYQLANTLNGVDTLENLLRAVGDATAEAIGCEQGFVLVRLADGTLRSSSVGFAGRVEEWIQIPPPGEAPPPRGEGMGAQVITEASELPNLRMGAQGAGRLGLHFPLLLAPLTSEEGTIGFVGASGRGTRRAPADAERWTLSYIADTASIALRRQLTYEKLRAAYFAIERQSEVLTEANRRLRILDQLRSQFLSFISHELATPLSMIGAIDMIDNTSNVDQTQLMDAVRSGYERLCDFVQKGVTYFSWLSKEPEDVAETADLPAVIDEAIAALPEPHRSRVAFDRSAETSCLVSITTSDLRAVLDTLLENAIKFSGETPDIRVELRAERGSATFSVSDRGRGFPPGWSKEIIEPFTVADAEHHHQGSGLSLAIAVAILQFHRGLLRAQSDGWDQGATFTATLRTPAARNSA